MADDKQADETGAAKPGKKKLILIIAAALVLVLAVGGGAAFFLLSGGEREVRDPGPREAIYVKLRTLEGRPMFVASLQAQSGQRHFMQIYAEAKTRDPRIEEALNSHMPLVVARLNTLFTTADAQVLRTVDGRRELQQQATEEVQRLMQEKAGDPGVEIVLFTNFVMQ